MRPRARAAVCPQRKRAYACFLLVAAAAFGGSVHSLPLPRGNLELVAPAVAGPESLANAQPQQLTGSSAAAAAAAVPGTALPQGATAAAALEADSASRAALLASLPGPSRDWASLKAAIQGDPGVSYDAASNQLVFACGGHSHGPSEMPSGGVVGSASDTGVVATTAAAGVQAKASAKGTAKCPATADPSTAFALHSRPGSPNKILLDFDGHTTEGTAWNEGGASSVVTPPYSTDADPAFSDDERRNIIAIWTGVAEDFKPFDVDVTTQDDGSAPSLRVVLGGKGEWLGFGSTGGAARLGSWSNATAQPVFVFTGAGSMFIPKMAWEAASHYIGHALGLLHKGYKDAPLSTGSGQFAPIMGAAYYRNVTQWSKGDYAGASNQDDELAIISARLPFVPQKAGTTPAAATPLAPGPAGADGLLLASVGGVVSRPDKTHYFAFTAPAAGPITISALPVADWCGPYGSAGAGNLNIQLQLLLNGAVVCSSNPDAPAGGTTVLANASISATATAGGAYVIALTAVGSAAGGYSDYGSLGGYTLQASWPSASYAAPRRPLRPPRPGRARPAEPFVMPAAGGVNGTLQPRVIIVPGITLCNVEGAAWYSWLRDRLRRAPLFLDVALRRMPDCMGARESQWIPFMRNELRAAEDTIIVGHSSGAIAAMRFAQKYKVAGIVLVATYETTLGLAMEANSEYFNTPWDWDKIKANAGFIIQFASTTDPWLGQGRGRPTGWSEQMDVAKQLSAELHVLARGHFLVPRFPELLQTITAKLMTGSGVV